MPHKNSVMVVGEFNRREIRDATIEGVERAGYTATVYKNGAVAYEHVSVAGTAAIIRHRQTITGKAGRMGGMFDSFRTYLNPESAQNRARVAEKLRQDDIRLLHTMAVRLEKPYLLLEPRVAGVTILGTAGDLTDTLFYERDGDPELADLINMWLHDRLSPGQATDSIARPNQA